MASAAPMPSGGPGSPVTVRAVAIGLVLGAVLNLVMCYSDFHLKNTLLTGNHFPTAGSLVLLVMVLGVNVASWKWLHRRGFSQGELLLIWAMVCVAGGIGNTAVMRYIPGWVAGPAYYTTASNDYATYLLANIPDWMVVSKDPNNTAIRWYFEGLPKGERIPWLLWVRPVAIWGLFGFLVAAASFALCSLFYRQWADRERLIFPITYLPLEMTAPPAGKGAVNAFLANPMVWAGAAIPVLVLGVNGLRIYLPALPAIPTQWAPGSLFPDRPWSELSIDMVRVYFSFVGVTFLLTTEVSFSLWFFYLLYRLSFVYVAWTGAAASGYWGNWYRQVSVFQCAGAVLVVAGFLFWTSRAALRAWLRRVARGTEDAADLLPARLAFVLLAGGFLGMVGWFVAAGSSWWAALSGIVLYVATLIVLTRIVAEAGMLYVGIDGRPFDVLTGLVPNGWLNGSTLAVFAMQKGVFMHDLREILLPYLMNGARAMDAVRANLRRVLAVLAVTAVVAFIVAAYGRITTAYKYGGVAGDDWANLWSQVTVFGELVEYQKTPPEYDWTTVGGVRILPVSVAHILTGAALTFGMLFMRSRFLWWPLNPFGYILCGTWEMNQIWFSVFLGWAFKSAIMTFGGASSYRKWLPFFLGLVLGEAMIAAVWVVTSLVTGRPGFYILPD